MYHLSPVSIVSYDVMFGYNGCVIYMNTGSAIAGVYRAASFRMDPTYALFFGVGQTLLILVFAYTRILATL